MYGSYRKVQFTSSGLSGTEKFEGEMLHVKIRRMMEQEESIDEIAPRLYTEKKDGVLPDYNIRTDRWEYAADAMDLVHKNEIAKSMSEAPSDKEGSDIKSSKGDPLKGGEDASDGVG